VPQVRQSVPGPKKTGEAHDSFRHIDQQANRNTWAGLEKGVCPGTCCFFSPFFTHPLPPPNILPILIARPNLASRVSPSLREFLDEKI
jgi:hypothetical protein